MSKGKNVALIIGGSLLVAGVVMGVITMATNGFDFTRKIVELERVNEEYATTDIQKIELNILTTDITISPSTDDKIHLDYDISDYDTYTITTTGGTLKVVHKKEEASFFDIYQYVTDPAFDIKVPSGSISEFNLNLTTGEIDISSLTGVQKMIINATTSDVLISNCQVSVETKITLTTGDLDLESGTYNAINIHSGTGQLTLNDVTTTNVEIVKTTGRTYLDNVNCSGSVSVHSSTGDIKLKRLQTTDQIDLTTTTGSITGSIVGSQADFNTTVRTATGESNLTNNPSGSKSLTVETTTGDIELSFVS